VVRGGAWFDEARFLRAPARYWNTPGHRLNNLGFRLARSG
jgi:formylglycine-generating enzyme required for sulfatase activity